MNVTAAHSHSCETSLQVKSSLCNHLNN